MVNLLPNLEGRLGAAGLRWSGRLVSNLVVRAPWTWPLLRPFVDRFFSNRALAWDRITDAGSARHLAPLSAAALYVKPHPERVLDLGTGTGEGALLMAREFPAASVRGVDMSSEMIRIAARKVGLDPTGRVAFKVADASNLPYDDDSFDLVTQLNMPPFVAELARVVRPGGSVVIATTAGPRTPAYARPDTIAAAFARRGFNEVARGSAADGEFWVGRRSRR